MNAQNCDIYTISSIAYNFSYMAYPYNEKTQRIIFYKLLNLLIENEHKSNIKDIFKKLDYEFDLFTIDNMNEELYDDKWLKRLDYYLKNPITDYWYYM